MTGIFPPVSSMCSTYGRVALLEEAIESFLRQDYPGVKELVVLNDLADQTLRFDHPEVRVVNLPRRFRTLGEKRRAVAALCSYDLLFPWDDDDICLPHRMSFSVERFDPEKGFFMPDRWWYRIGSAPVEPGSGSLFGASCWSRELFDRVGGQRALATGDDRDLAERFEAVRPGSTAMTPIRLADASYLYRWHHDGPFQMSLMGEAAGTGTAPVRAGIGERIGDAIADRIASGEMPRGEIALRPCWHEDYVGLVRAGRADATGGQSGG